MRIIDFKNLKKILRMNLIIMIIILIELTPVISAQTEKPVTFYLYNSPEIEREWPMGPSPTNYSLYGKLNTTPPDESKENYTYCPMDVENFTGSLGTIGYWFSEPIYYSINTTANITVNIWVKSFTNITNVSFDADIGVPGHGGYSGFHSHIYNQNLSNQPKLLVFGYNYYMKRNLKSGGRFNFELTWNYTPDENATSDNVTLISFSGDMQSSFQILLDSVTPEIKDYYIVKSKNIISISTKISDALGLKDIKQYSLSIIDPVEYVTFKEYIIDKNEYEILSNWTWNYGQDKIQTGNYTFILTAIDNSNNTWKDSITVFLEVSEEKDGDRNFLAFWITSIIIIVIILITYISLKMKKSKK